MADPTPFTDEQLAEWRRFPPHRVATTNLRWLATVDAANQRAADLAAALRDAIDWMDNPDGEPSSSDLVDRWRALLADQPDPDHRRHQ